MVFPEPSTPSKARNRPGLGSLAGASSIVCGGEVDALEPDPNKAWGRAARSWNHQKKGAPPNPQIRAQSVFKNPLRSRPYVISKEAPHRTIGSHEILCAD